MPKSISFWEHPIDKLEEALSIRRQIAALQTKLSGLFGSEDEKLPKAKPGRKSGKRTMSPEARARISAAQKARWAKSKGETTPTAATTKPKTAKKKKRVISAEGRAKMAAAARKRWAARKG